MTNSFIKIILSATLCTACLSPAFSQRKKITLGADQLEALKAEVGSQNIGLLVNQTSVVGKRHLADTLKSLGFHLTKIFSPEHGFRGTADAGEEINNGIDKQTGLPIISLYGNNKKPTIADLTSVDVVIFDIQDVGVRFFTYISSLHYLMEACAEQGKKVIVLDRPNPNGSYIDGPLLQEPFKSFVGMHLIPIVHGLTVGELALMINGEGWLANHKPCDLKIIAMKNYSHQMPYSLPIRPSPNLPNDHAIALYPSTCLFEGTVLSLGRGTQNPFEVVGHPDLKNLPYQFTPTRINGMAKSPVLENKICYGLDLRKEKGGKGISLKYLIDLYQKFPDKEKFFISYFDKLAGNSLLKEQIKNGLSEKEIKATWKKDLDTYKIKRKKYVLYP
jgi:uncharacterized protein YbbC (DUF1343 family)